MVREKLDEGIALFNSGEFFSAHEVLEDVWRAMPGGDREFMQALIQVAVALHHYSTGNLDGARTVLARAAATLNHAPDDIFGIVLPPLRGQLDDWQRALAAGLPPPPLPRLLRKERC